VVNAVSVSGAVPLNVLPHMQLWLWVGLLAAIGWLWVAIEYAPKLWSTRGRGHASVIRIADTAGSQRSVGLPPRQSRGRRPRQVNVALCSLGLASLGAGLVLIHRVSFQSAHAAPPTKVAPFTFTRGKIYLVVGGQRQGHLTVSNRPGDQTSLPRSHTMSERGLTAAFTVTPARPGLNRMSVVLRSRNGRSLDHIQARVVTTMLDMDMGNGLSALRPRGHGAFEGSYDFGMAGRWKLGVLVHFANGTVVPLTTVLRIGE
jgi:hypothetical protein